MFREGLDDRADPRLGDLPSSAVHGTRHELLVDLAVDSPPLGTPTLTAVGPTYPPEELAARKLLALFDRAEARDFVDLHTLSERFDLDRLLDLAAQLDVGFSPALLADVLPSISGSPMRSSSNSAEIHRELRAFFDRWRNHLVERPL